MFTYIYVTKRIFKIIQQYGKQCHCHRFARLSHLHNPAISVTRVLTMHTRHQSLISSSTAYKHTPQSSRCLALNKERLPTIPVLQQLFPRSVSLCFLLVFPSSPVDFYLCYSPVPAPQYWSVCPISLHCRLLRITCNRKRLWFSSYHPRSLYTYIATHLLAVCPQ